MTEILPVGGAVHNPRKKFGRVDRFVRPGVDIVMERQGVHWMCPDLHITKQGYQRVAYFLASRVLKEPITPPSSPQLRKKYGHINCFTSSGVEKGEGYLGGGTVASLKRIGYNPVGNFKEQRGKRQQQSVEIKKDSEKKWAKPPPNLDAQTSAEVLHRKMQCEEAVAAIEENELLKAKRRQDMEDEKRKDYEDIVKYNPWGQPAVGAPKLTNSGRIRTQLCGVQPSIVEEQKYDPFGMLRKFPPYPGHGSGMGGNYRRKQAFTDQYIDEFEKKKTIKERQRRDYYAKCLEKQRVRGEQYPDSGKDKCGPTDFIWSRTEVKRNLSGKLVPRRRQLYTLDHGPAFNKSYQSYICIADQVQRLPGHYPFRGDVDCSYEEWSKPGANALMKSQGNKATTPLSTRPSEASIKLPLTTAQSETKLSVAGTRNRRLSQPVAQIRTKLEPPRPDSSRRRQSLPVNTKCLTPPIPEKRQPFALPQLQPISTSEQKSSPMKGSDVLPQIPNAGEKQGGHVTGSDALSHLPCDERQNSHVTGNSALPQLQTQNSNCNGHVTESALAQLANGEKQMQNTNGQVIENTLPQLPTSEQTSHVAERSVSPQPADHVTGNDALPQLPNSSTSKRQKANSALPQLATRIGQAGHVTGSAAALPQLPGHVTAVLPQLPGHVTGSAAVLPQLPGHVTGRNSQQRSRVTGSDVRKRFTRVRAKGKQ